MSILKSTNSGQYKELDVQTLFDRGYHFDAVKAYSIGIWQYVSPITNMFSVFAESSKFVTNSLGAGDEKYLIPDLNTLIAIENYFKCLKTGHSANTYKQLIEQLKKVK